MKQQPDHLFHNKLENFQLKPSADAWNRIEAGLDKKSNKALWLKIAAGLLLLSIASVLIWKIQPAETDVLVNTKPQKTEPASEKLQPTQPEETAVAAVDPDKKVDQEKTEKKNNQIVPAYKKQTASSDQQLAVVESTPEEISVDVVQPETKTLIAEVETSTNQATETQNNTGVYILLTATEVNQKYLLPQPEDEATSEGKKSSRMQKLMGVAINLADGDGPLGDLRQKKDELFALNFLEDKKQTKKLN
ncbi:MAG: hypothetical protein KF803_18845 [Cyclobacteriaceae bacterium]|nr:hypothetical protein [Cyclobacteriaceae bacterium]